MTKKCTNCGEDTGELWPASTSPAVDQECLCDPCKKKHKPTKKRISKQCEPIPTGVWGRGYPGHSRGCGCSECLNVRRVRVVHAEPDNCVLGGVDDIGLEAFQCSTPLPQAPTQCRPFTKDSFARIDRTFAFPRVGVRSTTVITNVALTEGQPITHDNYGTLIVHPVLCEENTYELENPVEAGNGLDVIGKPVPCGKEFYFGYPKIAQDLDDVETLECNSLLEDFTVPAVNATANAVVRSYLGLKINDRVIIRNKVDPNLAYTFRVSGSTGANTLILENEGDGGTVGVTYTAASDVEGEFAWCVETLTDQSQCAQSADTLCMAHLLGCDLDGNPRKLTGDIENEAPVWDPVCGGFALKVIPKPIVCVLLDSCFQVAPVTDICNRQPFPITTLDDQKILDEAAAALLSTNADPLITICDHPFSLNLGTSVVGSLIVTPDFNPVAIVNFDRNCKVCIPEDCCFQCNPQVTYPVEAYFPPGLNKSLTMNIPSSIITGFGEYKMSVVKHPDTGDNILFTHHPDTNVVTAAYDALGNPIVLGTLPGDPNEYTYNSLDYCNPMTCPVDAQYEEDINVRFYGLVFGEQISFNYHTQFDVYNCFEVGSPGQALTSTQYGIMGHFVGPSKTSTIAFGTEPFGQVVPDVIGGGFKPYDAISNYKKRTFSLFYPTCVRISTVVTILLSIDEQWTTISEDWVYASATTFTVVAGAGGRYVIGQGIRFTQSGGLLTGVITGVADTLITFAGAAALSEPILDKFIRVIEGNKILQMESTSMFRTQNI